MAASASASATDVPARAEHHDASWLDWTNGEAIATRDIPEGTLIFTEEPLGCVSLVLLDEDAPGNALFPPHAQIVRPVHHETPVNQHAELAKSLKRSGITEGNVRDVLHVSADMEKHHGTMAAAVLLNEVPMICMWTGMQYGLAVCAQIAKMHRECKADADVFFGPGGRAYVGTMRAIPKGASVTVSFTKAHHTEAMCSCASKALSSGLVGKDCGCRTCTGFPCNGLACCTVDSTTMHGMDTTAWKSIYSPVDDMDLLVNANIHMATFKAVWETHARWLRRRPFALSRLARKIFAAADVGSPAERVVYARVLSEVADACDEWVTTRERTLMRSGALRFMSINNAEYENGQHKMMLLHQAALAWATEVVSIYPWAEAFVVDVCAVPLCRSPKMAEFLRGAWDARDISPAAVTAHLSDTTSTTPRLPVNHIFGAMGRDAPPIVCTVCSAPAKSHCGRCGIWPYCSTVCQAKAWPMHKGAECRPILSDHLAACDRPTDILDMWKKWPLRDTAIASYPRKELAHINSMIATAADKTGCTDDPLLTQVVDAQLDNVAMLRFMNPLCMKNGCTNTDRTKLRACTKCALVFYCDDACAKADWLLHRAKCT